MEGDIDKLSLTSFLLKFTVMFVAYLWVRALAKTTRPWGFFEAIGIVVLVVYIDMKLAYSGKLGDFSRLPPPFFALLVAHLALAFGLAFSKIGLALVKRMKLSQLVGFHAFRIFAELVIFVGVHEGVAPKQLSVEGFNFDLLVGLSAFLVARRLEHGWSTKWAFVWNIFGCISLANIAWIALFSLPTSFRYFTNEPSNIWVTGTPYVLLPCFLVTAALTGHILIFRKIRREAEQQ